MVRCEAADAAVCRIAETTFKRHKVTTRTFVPGKNYDAEIWRVSYQVSHLDPVAVATDDACAAEHARLTAELRRLVALPAEPSRWEETELDTTYADLWNGLEPSQRGSWLKAQGFRVTASRDAVTLSQPGHPRGMSATVSLAAGAPATAAGRELAA